jgi:hypothetical protein
MNAPKRKPARRRRYRINLIKGTYLYEPSEIAKLFHIHRNTVRHWLKEGLKPIDDRRPVLVHGSALKAFLARRQEGRHQKCAPGQFYCFRCRAPRTPWENLVDVAPHTETVAKLTAICCVCETRMHRTIRRADLPLAGFISNMPVRIGTTLEGTPEIRVPRASTAHCPIRPSPNCTVSGWPSAPASA